jgi:hypothetical protein
MNSNVQVSSKKQVDRLSNNDVTYYQREKKQKRVFQKASDPIPKGSRYGSYPERFQHIPESHDKEPNRKADLYIDLDKDGNISLTVKEALQIIKHFFDVYDVSTNEWRISFSGGKGVHLKLKAGVLGLEAGRWNLPLIYKALIKEIVDSQELQSVDLSIYCMRSGKPFRIENPENRIKRTL